MLVQHVDEAADVTIACNEVPVARGRRLRSDARRCSRPHHLLHREARASARDSGPSRLGARQHGHLRVPAHVPERAAAARRHRSAFRPRLRTRHHSVSRTARKGRCPPVHALVRALRGRNPGLLARRGNGRRVLRGEHRSHRHRAGARPVRSGLADLVVRRDHAAGEVRPRRRWPPRRGDLVARLRRLHRVRLDGPPLASVYRRARAFVRHDRERGGPAVRRNRPARAPARRRRSTAASASPPSSSSARTPSSTRGGSGAPRAASASSRRR